MEFERLFLLLEKLLLFLLLLLGLRTEDLQLVLRVYDEEVLVDAEESTHLVLENLVEVRADLQVGGLRLGEDVVLVEADHLPLRGLRFLLLSGGLLELLGVQHENFARHEVPELVADVLEDLGLLLVSIPLRVDNVTPGLDPVYLDLPDGRRAEIFLLHVPLVLAYVALFEAFLQNAIDRVTNIRGLGERERDMNIGLVFEKKKSFYCRFINFLEKLSGGQ